MGLVLTLVAGWLFQCFHYLLHILKAAAINLKCLSDHTRFGMYEVHKVRHDHEVFERSEFKEIPLVKSLLPKAHRQLGTSGGGNHFVEFGIASIEKDIVQNQQTTLPPGEYLAVLSHSGSRGFGANIAKHYTYLAQKQCPLPKQVQHLAWLDLNTHDGMEYWLAMNLAGDYAKACHENIHKRISKALGKSNYLHHRKPPQFRLERKSKW